MNETNKSVNTSAPTTDTVVENNSTITQAPVVTERKKRATTENN